MKTDESYKQYLHEISQYPLLTPEEEIELGKAARQGDKAAKEKLVNSNLRLVVKQVKNYVGLGVPLLDLIQEGNIGLMEAADKFDPDRGFRFSTYASYWIFNAITNTLKNNSRTIRLPANVLELVKYISVAQQELYEKLGRAPTAEEIAEELNKGKRKKDRISSDRITEILTASMPVASLDQTIDEEENTELIDLVTYSAIPTPEEQFNARAKKEALLKVLDSLEPREKTIIVERFGLETGYAQTLDEVGKKVNLTHERVRQLEIKAMNKLRSAARKNALAEAIK